MKRLADRLKEFRQRTRLSQRGFAALIDHDCGNYNKYERGLVVPGEAMLDKFTEACRLSEIEDALLRALASHERIAQFVVREVSR